MTIKTAPGTTKLEVSYKIENITIGFIDHAKRQAKIFTLQVAPHGNWFENRQQKFSFERAITIMDGTGKNYPFFEMTETVNIETSIGTISVNSKGQATLL